MKKLKFLALGIVALITVNASAQQKKVKSGKNLVDSTYTFIATSATPMNSYEISSILSKMPGGSSSGNIMLTDESYTVKLNPDSLIATLPYYGRSYSASYNQNDNGIKFTSTDFDYKSSKGKKNSNNITITPKDINGSYRLAFSVSENGYASLTVYSSQKQSISYNGYIKELRKDN